MLQSHMDWNDKCKTSTKQLAKQPKGNLTQHQQRQFDCRQAVWFLARLIYGGFCFRLCLPPLNLTK